MTHDIVTAALADADCACGAQPGAPCACEAGHIHLCRVARACHCGAITPADLASLIWGDAVTGMDTITDPGVTA